jgi:peptide subunit release factor 1 (eRF1)
MRLIEELERLLAREESVFRAQLLREDIARMRRLQAMAHSLDLGQFLQQGMRIGWTQGDARTQELREALEPFLEALYAGDEPRMVEAWQRLHRLRMERLVGCLATPVPKPDAG